MVRRGGRERGQDQGGEVPAAFIICRPPSLARESPHPSTSYLPPARVSSIQDPAIPSSSLLCCHCPSPPTLLGGFSGPMACCWPESIGWTGGGPRDSAIGTALDAIPRRPTAVLPASGQQRHFGVPPLQTSLWANLWARVPVASVSYFVGAGAVALRMAGLPWRGSGGGQRGSEGAPRGRLRDVAGVLPLRASEP